MHLGHHAVILRCDDEPSTVSLANSARLVLTSLCVAFDEQQNVSLERYLYLYKCVPIKYPEIFFARAILVSSASLVSPFLTSFP